MSNLLFLPKIALMPERDIGWGRKANQRNEYMMLIDSEVEISQEKVEWLSLNSLL